MYTNPKTRVHLKCHRKIIRKTYKITRPTFLKQKNKALKKIQILNVVSIFKICTRMTFSCLVKTLISRKKSRNHF